MSQDDKTVKLAKLEWYREVLALEPNSKLFLPLARLLARLGSEENNAEYLNEAFSVLRRGLDIHPDFMEARLFLIELLNMCGCKAQCGAEVARLASLFLSYPDFWDAWREYAITENESSDFTAALGFMSAIMRNKSLSIVQVLEAGLNALKTGSAPVFSADTLNIAKNIEKSGIAKMPAESVSGIENCLNTVIKAESAEHGGLADSGSAAEYRGEEPDEAKAAVSEHSAAEYAETSDPESTTDEELAEMLPKSHIENYTSFAQQQKILQQKTKSTKETLAELIKDANITVEPMDSSPFRTRSMADLLAEQGDYKGALEIYQELLHKGYGNKAELEERIADIKMLAPELDEEIDKSKLLAIDDMVDTSFGLLAKSPSTFESAAAKNVSAEALGLEVKDYVQNAAEMSLQDEDKEEFEAEAEAEEPEFPAVSGELAETEESGGTAQADSQVLESSADGNAAENAVLPESVAAEADMPAEETMLPGELSGDDMLFMDTMPSAEAKQAKEDSFAQDGGTAVQSADTEVHIAAEQEESEADFDRQGGQASDTADFSPETDNIGDEQDNTASAGTKAHTDVAQLLTKLAERLEIRAN